MIISIAYKLATVTMLTTLVSSSAYDKESEIRLRGAAYEKLLDYALDRDETDFKVMEINDDVSNGALTIEIDHVNNEKVYAHECNGIVETSFHQAFIEIKNGDDSDLDTNLTGVQFNFNDDAMMSHEAENVVGSGTFDFYKFYWAIYFFYWSCRFCDPSNDDDPFGLGAKEQENQFLSNYRAEFEAKIKDILVASDCVAFDDITAVHISYATPSGEDIMATD